jgi:hypothetical protein
VRFAQNFLGSPALSPEASPALHSLGASFTVLAPLTALLRLDAPRRQLAQKDLHAKLDLYNAYDVATTTIAGQPVPLEADETATLAYVLSSPELWDRELKAFFSGTQLRIGVLVGSLLSASSGYVVTRC